MKKWFIIAFLAVIILSCENNINKNYFLIQTGIVEQDDTLGVWFKAKIVNRPSGLISDHGFYWSYVSSSPGPGDDNCISLGDLLDKDNFSYFLPGNQIDPETKIYLRGYTKTDNYLSLGTIVSFEFNKGSDSYPRIYNVTPNPSQWDDTLTISGNNFSLDPDFNIIYYNYIITAPWSECTRNVDGAVACYTPVLESSPKMIKIIRPRYAQNAKTDLYISVRDNITDTFQLDLKPPEIVSVSPSEALNLGTIDIRGPNLGYSLSPTEVLLNNKQGYVTQQSPGHIYVLIAEPNVIPPGKVTLKVSFDGVTTEKTDAFTILTPEIVSCSPLTGNPGTIVTIVYRNIYSSSKIYIYFNSTAATITRRYDDGTNRLEVRVPSLPSGETEISLHYYNITDILETKFNIP
jgi:hypothetical protein